MTTHSARRKRPRGGVDRLPSGAFRVRVYAGQDPVTKRRHYLTEIVPAGPRAATLAEQALTRLLNQVDERRNPRTASTVNQLLDKHLELLDIERSTLLNYRSQLALHVRPFIGGEKVGAIDAAVLDSLYAELRRCRTHCRGSRVVEHRAVLDHAGTPAVCAAPAELGVERVQYRGVDGADLFAADERADVQRELAAVVEQCGAFDVEQLQMSVQELVDRRDGPRVAPFVNLVEEPGKGLLGERGGPRARRHDLRQVVAALGDRVLARVHTYPKSPAGQAVDAATGPLAPRRSGRHEVMVRQLASRMMSRHAWQCSNNAPDLGAPGGIRTPNLLIRSQMLYPLSYGRLFSSVSPTRIRSSSYNPTRRGGPPPHGG